MNYYNDGILIDLFKYHLIYFILILNSFIIYLFIYLFVCLFVCLFIYSFIHSFIYFTT